MLAPSWIMLFMWSNRLHHCAQDKLSLKDNNVYSTLLPVHMIPPLSIMNAQGSMAIHHTVLEIFQSWLKQWSNRLTDITIHRGLLLVQRTYWRLSFLYSSKLIESLGGICLREVLHPLFHQVPISLTSELFFKQSSWQTNRKQLCQKKKTCLWTSPFYININCAIILNIYWELYR